MYRYSQAATDTTVIQQRPPLKSESDGARSPRASSPSTTPRAIALNSSQEATINGQTDVILTNLATGQKSRWSASSTGEMQTTALGRKLSRISKVCLPRGGTYLTTIIGPIQARRRRRVRCCCVGMYEVHTIAWFQTQKSLVIVTVRAPKIRQVRLVLLLWTL